MPRVADEPRDVGGSIPLSVLPTSSHRQPAAAPPAPPRPRRFLPTDALDSLPPIAGDHTLTHQQSLNDEMSNTNNDDGDTGASRVAGLGSSFSPRSRSLLRELKRRKAQRYRDLTCPRKRTSQLADGTRIVTVGSHVLVYPPPTSDNGRDATTSKVKEGARAHPSNERDTMGAVTTFEEHPIIDFPDDAFKHYSLGVGLYFKGVRYLSILFFLASLFQFPSCLLAILSNPSDESESGLWFEKVSVGNFGSMLASASNTTIDSSDMVNNLPETDEGWSTYMPASLDRDTLVAILAALDFLVVLMIIWFGRWLSLRQRHESDAYSAREITVRKYTIEVGNLPRKFHDRLRLADWFSQRFGAVVDVAIVYDQFDLLEVYRHRGRIRKEIDLAVEQGEVSKLDALYDQLAEIDEKIAELTRDVSQRQTLGAFVTFERQESRIAAEKAFQHLWLKTLAEKVTHHRQNHQNININQHEGSSFDTAPDNNNAPIGPTVPSISSPDTPLSLLFGRKQRLLTVSQAFEPSNILFRNLKYSSRERFGRKMLTALATIILLLVSVIAVYVAQRYQVSLPSTETECATTNSTSALIPPTDSSDEAEVDCFCSKLGTTGALDADRKYGVDCGAYLTKVAIARALSVLAVLVIVVVNLLLKSIIKLLTIFEKHTSLTRMQESITTKLFVGLFLNTGIVLLVVNMSFQQWIGTSTPSSTADASAFGVSIPINSFFDGRYSDFDRAWFVHVGSSITLTMIFNIFNPHLFPFLCIPWQRWRRTWKCCLPGVKKSQSVWNERFAGETFELAERYAVLLNTLFVTLLYSAGMPALLPIAATTFLLTYLMDRASFLRLYRIPPRYDHSLALYTTALLPYAILLHLAFAIWFLTSPVLLNDGSSSDSASSYSSVFSRVSRWQVTPLLVLFCAVLVYIIFVRWWGWVFRVLFCTDKNGQKVLSDGALSLTSNKHMSKRKFVPYSVARRTVSLETYHPHGSPHWHDCFIRTESRKMMKVPQTLAVLQAIKDETLRKKEMRRKELEERRRREAMEDEEESQSHIDAMRRQTTMMERAEYAKPTQLMPGPRSPSNAPSPPQRNRMSSSYASIVNDDHDHEVADIHPSNNNKHVAEDDDDEMPPQLSKAASLGLDLHACKPTSKQDQMKARAKAKNAAMARANIIRAATAQGIRVTNTHALNPPKTSADPASPISPVAEKQQPRLRQPKTHPAVAPLNVGKKDGHLRVPSSSSSSPPVAPSPASPISTAAAPTSPTFAQSPLRDAAVVVLDIPEDHEVSMAQARAEALLNISPSAPSLSLAPDDEEGADIPVGYRELHSSSPPRPFTSHLQRPTCISLPSIGEINAANVAANGNADGSNATEDVRDGDGDDVLSPATAAASIDPMLAPVSTQLHRLATRLWTAQRAHEPPGSIQDSDATKSQKSKKSTANNKKQKKQKKSAKVHDASLVPSLSDASSSPSTAPAFPTPETAVQDEVQAIRPAEGSEDATALNPSVRSSSPPTSLPSETDDPDSAESMSNLDAPQLVPISCPNIECGRMLELVDTGNPQLYHCPYCTTSFIM